MSKLPISRSTRVQEPDGTELIPVLKDGQPAHIRVGDVPGTAQINIASEEDTNAGTPDKLIDAERLKAFLATGDSFTPSGTGEPTSVQDGLDEAYTNRVRSVSEWETDVSYSKRDVVLYGGKLFSALVAHVAGVFSVDQAAGKWEEKADVSTSIQFTPSGPGGVTIPVETKIRQMAEDVISIKDERFGAVGDGETDDTDAFLAVASTTGRAVLVPPGHYLISEEIPLEDIILLGGGAGNTLIEVQTSTITAYTNLPYGLHFTGEFGGIRDLLVRGQKDSTSLSSYPNGFGRVAVFGEATKHFLAENVRVENWLGAGFAVRGDSAETVASLINCTVSNYGRPAASPGIEHGDAFYLNGATKALFLNCHSADPGSEGSGLSRGGITCVGENDEVSIVACSARGAGRSIHLEQIPNKAVIDDFYGEGGRNGIILYGTLGERRHVSLSRAHFKDCGDSSDGVIHTAECGNLELFCSDVFVETPTSTGNIYRHHAGDAPRILDFKALRDDGSSHSGFSIAAGEVERLSFENCEITGGETLIRRARYVSDRNSVFLNLAGNNGGDVTPRRKHRFYGSTIGRGLSDAVPISSQIYADALFDGCFIEHNSSDGSHGILSVVQGRVEFSRCRFFIAGTSPSTAFAATNSVVIVDMDDAVSGTAGDIAKVMTSSGTVHFKRRVAGDVETFLPTGKAAYETARLILNGNYLWVDSTGTLRIKSSAPTSDTDGTVVGTQS